MTTQSNEPITYDVDFFTGQPYPIWQDLRGR